MTDRPAPPRHRAPSWWWYLSRRARWTMAHPFARAPWEA